MAAFPVFSGKYYNTLKEYSESLICISLAVSASGHRGAIAESRFAHNVIHTDFSS
jgi:hypothetical protein